jgi:SAM-dependent methyltransferase
MFKGQDPSLHGNHWHKLWDEKHTPWDRGQASPALIEVLQDRKDLIGESFVVDPAFGRRRKRALVPGCGRGYDVLILSAFGYDAYGLDISEIGIREAKDYQKDHFEDEAYKARGPEGKGRVTWAVGDFFKDEFLKEFGGEATFDLIYDYTVSHSTLIFEAY